MDKVTRLLYPLLVGIVVGLGAIAFSATTGVVTRLVCGGVIGLHPAPPPAGEPQFPWPPVPVHDLIPWLLLIVPAVGGLLSGGLISRFAPEAAGPGMDSAIRAFHEQEGMIRGRLPLLKILATAITVGSGGSGGRGGPIAHIGAGLGSWLGQVLKVPVEQRKVLLAAGMGAGIAAVFHAPIAGTIFAAEILTWTWALNARLLLPAAIASLASYAVYGGVLGWTPYFRSPDLPFARVLEIGPQLLLALAMAGLARVYTLSYSHTNQFSGRLKLPAAVKPALGAFLAGALGLALYAAAGKDALSVLSWGLDSLQRSLDQPGTAGLLLVIALGKIATTSLTIGSGGSGGLFGPALVIGGCAGGALGVWMHGLWPDLVPNPAAYVILGMGAFFSAASKAPFAMVFMVCELTGAWRLLPASALVCIMSFVLSGRATLFPSQRERPSQNLQEVL